MARLFVKALEHDIETEYVQYLVRWRRVIPEQAPVHLENWPWPVQIYTLGRFEVMVEGASLRFAGKAQKKPLELPKVLIAFGGEQATGRS